MIKHFRCKDPQPASCDSKSPLPKVFRERRLSTQASLWQIPSTHGVFRTQMIHHHSVSIHTVQHSVPERERQAQRAALTQLAARCLASASLREEIRLTYESRFLGDSRCSTGPQWSEGQTACLYIVTWTQGHLFIC